jgi:hypothetical protein
VEALGKARQRLQGFLLRHGRTYDGKRWTWPHRKWLMEQTFPHPAQQVACGEYLDAVNELEARIERLTGRIRDLVPAPSMAPVVEALQAMRGVSLIVASAPVAEVGDFGRFDNPRQLMAYLGLVPSEHSSGAKRRQGAITEAGSPLARRMLVEGAWTYRLPARVSAQMRPRLAGLPREVRDVAWRAQVRLCARYRRLQATGKRPQVVVTAIAREMVGFAPAIARMVTPPVQTAPRPRGATKEERSDRRDVWARRWERSGEPSETPRGGHVPIPAPRGRQPRDDGGHAVSNPRIRAGSTVARHPPPHPSAST